MTTCVPELNKKVTGEFITIQNERFYAIRNVDQMAPFFISLVSDSDHWLFAASNGGLTAGRVSPETALFPYESVDKIYDSSLQTGSKTLFRVSRMSESYAWQPFNPEQSDRYPITRNIYKNSLGNKLCFEEVNHQLQLTFRYTWMSSDSFGFVRHCELINSGGDISVEMIDGLQNILPAGTPRYTQSNSSNLVDAYKWTELDAKSGVAMFTLFSAITDRAEPCESLRANTLFSLGLENHKVLLSSEQLTQFKKQRPITQEEQKRGIRGSYLVNQAFELASGASKEWQIVANVELSQAQVTQLIQQLEQPEEVAAQLNASVAAGSDALARIMGSADGFQTTNEEVVSVHHYANVLFNVLRGGIFDAQYQISGEDFARTIALFNRGVHQQHQTFLSQLPESIDMGDLFNQVSELADPQLQRLCMEYLPITFGRRHGDPSRPWNQFAIKLKDEQGNRLLSYQGNWRDIFQNWEALSFSYPEFVENIIAKFVNASTVDGYNPYRITKEGIGWEEEEPDNPWSYIGYWGDHQIIYLLKLLEWSRNFHPEKLSELLHQSWFSYANVPYKIKPFAQLVKNAKDTVLFDHEQATKIEQRVEQLGADGKLVLDASGQVYQVNLLEKLLVPLLSKLGNLVLDGGIWMNTQRPEWNDANNALVGQGLSMVTLYYMRRYIHFMQELLRDESQAATISDEVVHWLKQTAQILKQGRTKLEAGTSADSLRFELLKQLGEAASHYRQTLYQNGCFKAKSELSIESIQELLADALTVIDHTITNNESESGLYQAYNLLALDQEKAEVNHLYAMLEGQVAALSSGAMPVEKAAQVLETLFSSSIYRDDQKTFMLYPDRPQPSFLNKNVVPTELVESIPLLQTMLEAGDYRLVEKDAAGNYRFQAELQNVGALNARLDELCSEYPDALLARPALQQLYELVFNHRAFTGRSGGMFGFEGLGCIYWHMVSKLLLAAQENFNQALERGAATETVQALGELYYRIREGIGFNKTPLEYGAFPTDPYSHTPKHAGAQQPGMTGQVKEEVLTRFGELGIQVKEGQVHFNPALLRSCEFMTEPGEFTYLDVTGHWQVLAVAKGELAFSWCQVPILYRLTQSQSSLILNYANGEEEQAEQLNLSKAQSQQIFRRTGQIKQLVVELNPAMLLS